MNINSNIYIAGHTGMVGSAIVRTLQKEGFKNLILKLHTELDLTKENETEVFFKKYRPDYVINAAGRVGGIKPNIKFPVEFLTDNFLIIHHLLNFSNKYGVKRVVTIGSSCMYPKDAEQPFKEDDILTGVPEPTNEGFAISKISGLKLSQYYTKQYGLSTLNLIPSNLYGTKDHYDLENSHVLSALVMKFVDATDMKINEVSLWGTGIPRREFMHVNDFADALLFLIYHWDSPEFINVGTGNDISIANLAKLVINETHYKGKLLWDTSKPDGMLKKCMDISKLNRLGFKCKISINAGIKQTIKEYNNLKIIK